MSVTPYLILPFYLTLFYLILSLWRQLALFVEMHCMFLLSTVVYWINASEDGDDNIVLDVTEKLLGSNGKRPEEDYY